MHYYFYQPNSYINETLKSTNLNKIFYVKSSIIISPQWVHPTKLIPASIKHPLDKPPTDVQTHRATKLWAGSKMVCQVLSNAGTWCWFPPRPPDARSPALRQRWPSTPCCWEDRNRRPLGRKAMMVARRWFCNLSQGLHITSPKKWSKFHYHLLHSSSATHQFLLLW